MANKYALMIKEAETIIKRNMIKYHYKKLYVHKKVHMATLYLESSHPLATAKVSVFGSFSHPKPWQIKYPCVFDPNFNCFKSISPIKIKQGHAFKFIVDEGKAYLNSRRYAL
jgi:hypothetical protein